MIDENYNQDGYNGELADQDDLENYQDDLLDD